MDKQTEADLARPDNFISNFEPLTSERGCGEMVLAGRRVRKIH